MDGSTQIGTWQVIDNQIIATFNNEVESKLSVTNGYFEFSGKSRTVGENQSITINGNVVGEITVTEKPSTLPNEYAPEEEFISKNGYQMVGQNEIQWNVRVNHADQKSVYEGGSYTQKNNVILIDELTDGQTISSYSVYPLLRKTLDTGDANDGNIIMSTDVLAYDMSASLFTEITQDPADTYVSFKAKIEAMPRSRGVYQGSDSDNNQVIMVNFGNFVQGDGSTGTTLWSDDASLAAYLDSKLATGNITAEQRIKMYDAYASTNATNGEIIAYTLGIVANATGIYTYTNEATITSTSGSENTQTTSVNFNEFTGGATLVAPGSALITKSDDGNLVEGIEFKLQKLNEVNGLYEDYYKSGTQMNGATDQYGQLKFSGLEPGTYKVVEENIPTEYTGQVTYSPSDTFTYDTSDKVGASITVENELYRGSVILTKTDNSNNKLEGAQFYLRDNEGNYYSDNSGVISWVQDAVDASVLISNSDGEIIVPNLLPNDYSFEEKEAPNGYLLDTSAVNFTITPGESTPVQVSKINVLDVGDVELTKKDTSSSPLSGAVFSLYNENDVLISSGHTTNDQGKIAIDNLTPGNYYFLETSAPSGYILDTTPVAFTITSGQTQTVQVTKVNELLTGGVVLEKTNADGSEHLADAEFALYASSGTLVDDYTTNSAGMIAVNYLLPGDYYFVETKAPSGYSLDSTPVDFKIEIGQVEGVSLTVINYKIKDDKAIINPPIDEEEEKNYSIAPPADSIITEKINKHKKEFEFNPSSTVGTFDKSNLSKYLLLAVVSSLGILFIKRKKYN